MLGFSVYLGEPFDEDYIEMMLQEGSKYIFTSLQIPEDDSAQYIDKLQDLRHFVGDRAEIIADASPHAFQNLGLSYDEPTVLKEMGIDWIRLDISMDVPSIVSLLDEVKIVCNASTDAIDLLHKLSQENIDMSRIMVAHNYYPRPETGLDREYFKAQNQEIKVHFPDVSIMAFVPGTTYRGPVFKGLPTLEDHRHTHPLVAAYELLKLGVDDICIGDSYMQSTSLFQLSNYIHNGIVSLYVTSESSYLDSVIGKVFHNRKDKARDVIRAEEARAQHNQRDIHPERTVTRSKGAITLDNIIYGRYMHELQIAKVNLERHEGVNVIGYVCKQDIECIDIIDSGQAFQFVKGEEI
ncbi:MupG family TIM beta-alpha barrel fold protein [Mammaliicoccus sp. Dog046]|uniref:MupG family TIM beta-alpha barrel fold protein n=1 Tax=Mammaliicoccus sp. Dog046 TaxID=3034233 RepID=UPI002B263449|nr:MupG family TIM beta-alpha barrel fold protein [Mammaliicoccus sp. Dog046]WQK85795.1 MupG family TIM beta-alpha barrel fold protein [Mammaliicoccus sp. Dog046]